MFHIIYQDGLLHGTRCIRGHSVYLYRRSRRDPAPGIWNRPPIERRQRGRGILCIGRDCLLYSFRLPDEGMTRYPDAFGWAEPYSRVGRQPVQPCCLPAECRYLRWYRIFLESMPVS